MPKLSTYDAVINSHPELKRQKFKVKAVKTTATLLWIASILILIYQVQSNNFQSLALLWGACLILSIVFSSFSRRMARKLILAAEKYMPSDDQAVAGK